MADELLLASSRVFPKRLQEAGFEYRFGTFEAAMEDLLTDESDQ
jgi:NAD dependent epimerase/dehydratase family enzyme